MQRSSNDMAKPPRNATPTPPLARLAETCPSVETALGIFGILEKAVADLDDDARDLLLLRLRRFHHDLIAELQQEARLGDTVDEFKTRAEAMIRRHGLHDSELGGALPHHLVKFATDVLKSCLVASASRELSRQRQALN